MQKSRSSFTHLVSVPFTNPEFVASYLHFKDTVLKTFRDSAGIDDSLFQNAKKLHLTVTVLTLENDETLKKAGDLLRQVCSSFIASEPVDLRSKLQIKSLASMNADSTRTKVLYAMVEDDRLQALADKVATEMTSSGYVFKDDKSAGPVKLHITLMNTVFARRKAMRNRKRKTESGSAPKSFDSTQILEHYRDFVFADIDFPPIQLNDVRLESEDGYYKVIESVNFC